MAIRRYFQTDAEWEKEFQAIKELLPKLTEFKGKLGDSADNLLEALQYEDEISMRLGKLYTYAHMRYDRDTTNSVYQALNDAQQIYIHKYLVAQRILFLKFYRFQKIHCKHS